VKGISETAKWYNDSYKEAGFKGQRLYPNEELLRFLGQRYFSRTNRSERSEIRVLEIGCGSCANLWMIGREGFEAHGIDLSSDAIDLGRAMLKNWGATAELKVGSMTNLPYSVNYFDLVVDVFSSNCLDENDFRLCLKEVQRTLKVGGLFFSYVPSARSDAFTNHLPAVKLDESTLDGIKRDTSPYFGNNYPFRFTTPTGVRNQLDEIGMDTIYLETTGRTYRDRTEYFEFLSFVGKKRSPDGK
jgi:SAM-dependent methyltransferase